MYKRQALFGEVMRGELEILSFETQDADPVDCRGILWGGNLAMLASLIGTPYMPKAVSYTHLDVYKRQSPYY